MARLATENYARLESFADIKPPYPERGSPNWWALRQRYEQLLAARLRMDREGKTPAFDHNEAVAARWAALGNETADADYQRYVR